jgi:multiple antibiotic resistance protein
MSFLPLPFGSVVGALLVALPALFSIVNPLGGAIIFSHITRDRSHAERAQLARRIGLYALSVLLVSLWFGGYILNFFGITLGALRVAGGLVVAFSAWRLLMTPEQEEERKGRQVDATDLEDIAFFPLTMPLTTGPGTIAVAIALASLRPEAGTGTMAFFAGLSLAAAAIALLIWLAYHWADRVIEQLGTRGTRTFSRISAFLLLCIGVQIVCTGLQNVLQPIVSHAS